MRPRRRPMTRRSFHRPLCRQRRADTLEEFEGLKEKVNAIYDEAADFLVDSLGALETLFSNLHVDFETAEDPVSNDPEIYEAVTFNDYGRRASELLDQFSYGITKSIELSKKAHRLKDDFHKRVQREKSERQMEEAMEFEQSYFGR